MTLEWRLFHRQSRRNYKIQTLYPIRSEALYSKKDIQAWSNVLGRTNSINLEKQSMEDYLFPFSGQERTYTT
jgi:hypothetical protein